MDNTGFILAFLRDLEWEMKRIGFKISYFFKNFKKGYVFGRW